MEKVRIERNYLVSHKNIYNEESVAISTLLGSIPQTTALELISYTLHKFNIRKKDDYKFHSNQLLQWVRRIDEDDKDLVFEFIQTHNDLIISAYFKFISRRSCLNLLQSILIHSSPGDSMLKSEDHTKLFKCLLYFNTLENTAQSDLFNWNGSGNIQEFANQIIPIHFRNIEHVRHKDYKLQFLKVYYFFVFCELHEVYSNYLTAFLESLGIKSYKSYLWKILSPYLDLMLSEEPLSKMVIAGNKDFLSFYDNLTINGKIVESHYDYRQLRQYPLYKIQENIYLFLDYRLFIDKFYQGFLFDFAKRVKISYPKLKGEMGMHFSEHILFYTIMEKCFVTYGSIRLNGEELKIKLKEAEPDYYIREGSAIFLFEFKDIVINADVKHSGNIETIKTEILGKLELSSKKRKKGISQLISSIMEIEKGVYQTKDLDQFDPMNISIYPILVHTDVTLEAYGVNHFLKNRFIELSTSSEFIRHKVENLIVLNLDTLIQLQDHFRNGTLKLGECINKYNKYIAVNNPETATFPFDEYIRHLFSEKTNLKIGIPQDFRDIISIISNSTTS